MPEVSLNGINFKIVGDAGQASASIKELNAQLAKLRSNLASVSSASRGTKSIGSIGQVARSAAHSFARLSVATGKFGLKLASLPIKKAVDGVKDFAGGLKSVIGSFKRILGYRIIRSIIKEITKAIQEGVKNLYGWSSAVGGKFAASMNQISTSMLYFKNSIGAAVAPIVNALAPAIDFLIDKIVTLINIINQLFAKLAGAASWTAAKKKATEYGDAVGGAGSAAKEALRYLAPFDELNVLPDDKNGGGGGGGGTDYSGMFEEMTEFNEAVADFADSLREKINAGDWQGLGQLIGGKINELIDSVNWSGLGTSIGQKINALFTTEYWEFQTINFQNIGAHIAELLTGDDGIGGALREINFVTIGALITEKMTVIPDLIIGALEKLDWNVVGDSVGDLIKGAFSNLSAWIRNVQWDNVASSVYTALKDAIAGADVGGVAKSIFVALGSAIGATASFVVQFAKDVVADIWTAIKNNAVDFNGDGEYTGGEILTGILKGIENGLKSIGTWIKENIWNPFVEGIKSTFGIHSPAETMEPFGQDIFEGILEGIITAIKNIGTWIKENIWNPFVDGIKEIFGIGQTDGELATAGEDIGQGLLDGMGKPWEKLGDFMHDNLVQPLKDKVKDVVDTLTSEDTWALVWAWLQDLPAKFKQGGIDAVNALAQPIIEGINSIIDEWNNLVESVQNSPLAPNWLKDKIGNLTIDPIDVELIPSLDQSELTRHYDEVKAMLEEESRNDPINVDADATIVKKPGFKEGITNADGLVPMPAAARFEVATGAFKSNTDSGGRPNFFAHALFSRFDPDFRSNTDSGGRPKFFARAEFTRSTSSFPDMDSANRINIKARALFQRKTNDFQNMDSAGRAIIGARADFTRKTNDFQSMDANGRVIIGARADFTRKTNNFSTMDGGNRPIFESLANFVKRQKNISTDFDSKADFKDKATNFTSGIDDKGRPIIAAKADIKDWSNGLTYTPTINVRGNIVSTNQGSRAVGGVFSGGAWHDIAKYGSGGMPRGSQLFWARERGPELVGTLGGNTAVMNNDQIVSSVSAGVARAIASIRFQLTGLGSPSAVDTSGGMSEDAMYRAFKRALDETDFDRDIELDGYTLYSAMVKRNKMERTRTGINPMMLGG